jgi:FkbM family methyltransferase
VQKEKGEVVGSLENAYFSDQMHERAVIERLPDLLSGALFFADIGASLGQYTYFADKALENGRILSVEADPLRFAELKKNCEKWRETSSNTFEPIFGAVADKDGEIPFFSTGSATSGGLFRHDDDSDDRKWKTHQVPVHRLDKLFEKQTPDLVKIDVEGAELLVLRGAKEILNQGRTMFLVEVHSFQHPETGAGPAEVFHFMRSFGYRDYLFFGQVLFAKRLPSIRLAIELNVRTVFGKLFDLARTSLRKLR